MADRNSASRGSVPIALGSAAGGTEEGREFFQARLALFVGWGAVISGGFFVAYFLITLWTGQHIEFGPLPTGDPNLYHLAATLITGAAWIFLARRREHLSMRTLEWLEATCTVLICTCFAVMGIGFALGHVAIGQDPMHGIFGGLVATGYVLLMRAVSVPSTPLRTFIVSSVALLPTVVLGPYVMAGVRVPGLNLIVLVDVIIWSIATVAMAVVASRVIFGLRTEVDKIRRLGQYTIEGKLGEGGMGVVYRASHAMLRRPTAIKILRPEIASEDALRRFEREVQMTAGLSHPSTVAIFDYGRTPRGLFYYAMEYLDGLNLDQLVRMEGRQPPARVVHILRQICGALGEAHAVGLIHRDVKPANIILSERGGLPDVAKIVDFGLVKPFETARTPTDVDMTTANVILGTPLYTPPEAITGKTALDGRSDLYALGAVGYFLLTGTPIFPAASVVEVCANHLHTPPELPSIRSGIRIPEDLERIILRCLAKRPEDRYDSAKLLQHALDRCAESLHWDNETALQWWAAYRSGRHENSAMKLPVDDQQTIAIDIAQRFRAPG